MKKYLNKIRVFIYRVYKVVKTPFLICASIILTLSLLFFVVQTLQLIRENRLFSRFIHLQQQDFDTKVSESASAIKTLMAGDVADDERFKLGAIVVKYATKYQLDPLDIISVIKHESNFNRKTVSETGDYGLMGINWYWVGQYFVDKKETLFDPEVNIELGCKQLVMWREFVRKNKGNELDIFNHYNSGTLVEFDGYSKKIKQIRGKL